MVKRIERTRNTNNSSSISDPINLNSTTAVTIVAANPDRIFLDINNDNSANGFWVKLQAASVDDDKKGIFITSKVGSRPFWQMPNDNVYTGEISAIADADSPKAYVTEY